MVSGPTLVDSCNEKVEILRALSSRELPNPPIQPCSSTAHFIISTQKRCLPIPQARLLDVAHMINGARTRGSPEKNGAGHSASCPHSATGKYRCRCHTVHFIEKSTVVRTAHPSSSPISSQFALYTSATKQHPNLRNVAFATDDSVSARRNGRFVSEYISSEFQRRKHIRFWDYRRRRMCGLKRACAKLCSKRNNSCCEKSPRNTRSRAGA